MLRAAIDKLRAEKWSGEQIAKLLLSQSKKEQLKSFTDSGDATPTHGELYSMPPVTADKEG